ncbi:mucin-2-like isoform X2 [Ornithodoros turicata]
MRRSLLVNYTSKPQQLRSRRVLPQVQIEVKPQYRIPPIVQTTITTYVASNYSNDVRKQVLLPWRNIMGSGSHDADIGPVELPGVRVVEIRFNVTPAWKGVRYSYTLAIRNSSAYKRVMKLLPRQWQKNTETVTPRVQKEFEVASPLPSSRPLGPTPNLVHRISRSSSDTSKLPQSTTPFTVQSGQDKPEGTVQQHGTTPMLSTNDQRKTTSSEQGPTTETTKVSAETTSATKSESYLPFTTQTSSDITMGNQPDEKATLPETTGTATNEATGGSPVTYAPPEQGGVHETPITTVRSVTEGSATTNEVTQQTVLGIGQTEVVSTTELAVLEHTSRGQDGASVTTSIDRHAEDGSTGATSSAAPTKKQDSITTSTARPAYDEYTVSSDK